MRTLLIPALYCRKLTRSLSQVAASNRLRVRFAPSPTGDLHLGGLRTALYNYLFAKKHGGVFILRCEDTDQTRLVPGAMEKLISLLEWVGIKIDEGTTVGGPYAPYTQSERLALYHHWSEHLMKESHAYRCFCSPTRLDLLRREQARRQEKLQGYDNLCRNLTEDKVAKKLAAGEPYVIRFKMSDEVISWRDLVYGDLDTDSSYVEGDPVIIKSDGYPTYHLANVVDDHLMEITHVLRGSEWQSSTPKHLKLFSAFGWTPPQYAHLPLLLNQDGTKLSKRQEGLRVEQLKNEGYEPESIISLLSLAGGGVSLTHKQINEVGVSLQSAQSSFTLDSIRTQSSVLDMDRLPSLNQAHLLRLYRSLSKSDFCDKITQAAPASPLQCENLDSILKAVYDHYETYSDRIHTLGNLFKGDFEFVWHRPGADTIRSRLLSLGDVESCVRILCLALDSVSSTAAESSVSELAKKAKTKKSLFFKTLRISLTGTESGVPITMAMDLLGHKELTVRLKAAAQLLDGS